MHRKRKFEAAPAMGMGPGKRHTGARLAVVCCWWGQRGKQAHVEERWHLMGQRRDKGWSAVLLSLMDQSSCPPLCASISITEATSPRGVFWPFERPELILSYLMCVPVWAAYWSKPFSNQLHDCKALQCPCPYACPLSSIANWVAPQPDHLDICRWAALGLMSLNVEESQAAGWAGALATGPIPISAGNSASRFPWQVWVLSNAKHGSFTKILDNFNTIKADILR